MTYGLPGAELPRTTERVTLDDSQLTPRYSLTTLRAAWWALVSIHHARRRLHTLGARASLAAPPKLPSGARRGVEAVLRRRPTTCLERSLVIQSWLAAQDIRCDIVVGVTREDGRTIAHAWIDRGYVPNDAAKFVEITRFAAS